MKAKLRQYRQAPRKVRLVADFVRGKEVIKALDLLLYINKRAARPFRKLILSAVANAKEAKGFSQDELFIKEVRVDKGLTYKRFRARARGRAAAIHKHTSNISIALETKKLPESPKTVEPQPKADEPLAQKRGKVKKETKIISKKDGKPKKTPTTKTSKASSSDQSKTGLGKNS